jgi:predicted O-methyltransferase YrrM
MSNDNKYFVTTMALDLSRAFGYLFPHEVYAMQAFAHSLPAGSTVVNIGAGSGTSSLAMTEANPSLKIWTVDISLSGPLGGMENERNAFAGTGLTLPTQILGDSKEIGRNWPVEGAPDQLDLIFVDGDHSIEGITGDILAWKGHVKPGGLMLFHDYTRDVWQDVKPVVDKMMADCTPLLHVDTLKIYRVGNGN